MSSSSFFSARSAPALANTRRRRGATGFTLIELLVVVVIIGVLSAIAVPSVVERLRERRSQEAADRIASLYRGARMRAMGRGSAVSVRYDAGAFTILEAVQQVPGDATCLLPFPSCTNPPQQNQISAFDVANRSEYEGISVTAGGGGTMLDVCFTPLGSAYSRTAADDPLSPLGQVLTFAVNRGTSGLTRTVTLLPNGIARVTAKAATP